MRFPAAAILMLALVAAMAVGASEQTGPPPAIGRPAPSFALPDLDGKERKLSDYRGRIVVLEWTNPDCPFIKRCYRKGVIKKTLEEIGASEGDCVYLAINSTGDIPRDEVVARSRAFKRQRDLRVPVLVDHDGAVGRAYDARRTPHVFVIDQKGVLRYHGAYTDDETAKKPDARNFVINAVDQIRAGRPVSPDHWRPWGCSVKYAK